ncbi:hypothetical protein B5S33_g5738 [[Candida] boidinii]|nr:hypothetical protein B5S33_g5738 [[Candida] boidinii]
MSARPPAQPTPDPGSNNNDEDDARTLRSGRTTSRESTSNRSRTRTRTRESSPRRSDSMVTKSELRNEIGQLKMGINNEISQLKNEILSAIAQSVNNSNANFKSFTRSIDGKFESKTKEMDEKFEFNTRAMNEQFESNTRAMNEQFESNTRAMSDKLESTTRAINDKFESTTRAINDNLESNAMELKRQVDERLTDMTNRQEASLKMFQDLHNAQSELQEKRINKLIADQQKKKTDSNMTDIQLETSMAQVETDVKSLSEQVDQDKQHIRQEVHNLDTKMDLKNVQVGREVKNLKDLVQNVVQPRIKENEDQIELQRLESRGFQQKIEIIDEQTNQKVDNMNQQFGLLSCNVSKLQTKTQDEIDNVDVITEGAIRQSDDLGEKLREQEMKVCRMKEEYELGLQASKEERKQLENQINQIKKEIFFQRNNTSSTPDLIKKDSDATRDANLEYHLVAKRVADLEEKLTKQKQEIDESIRRGILEERKRISLGDTDMIASLTNTFEQIRECLPYIIMDETHPALVNCTLGIRATDAKSMLIKPIRSTDSLESKYKSIVSLQRQLIFKYVKYTEWASYLIPLISSQMQETGDFPATVTTNRWNQIIIKLLSTHNIKQERWDTIEIMLAETPPAGTNVKTWLTNFVVRIREARTADNLQLVIRRVHKILASFGIVFDNERLYSSTNYDKLLNYIKFIAMKQVYLNEDQQISSEDKDIMLGIESFYDADGSNENLKHLNYANKKFITQGNNQSHKTYNQGTRKPNNFVIPHNKNRNHGGPFPHNKKYWCYNCTCDSCKEHIKRFDNWKKSNRPNKRIYQVVSNMNTPDVFYEYLEEAESTELFSVDSATIQMLRQELEVYEDLYKLSPGSDELKKENLETKFLKPQEASIAFAEEQDGSSY